MSLASRVLLATLLLGLTGSSARAEESVKVVVAARALRAGTVLAPHMLAQRAIPESLVTKSMVTPGSSAYVMQQRLLEPLDEGQPLLWSQMVTSFFHPVDFKPYCQWMKEAEKGRRSYPAASNRQGVIPVLVAAQPITSGTVLAREMLETRHIPAKFVSPFWVLEGAADSVIGQRVLGPLEKGDPLRYSQFPVYASEPRCDWLFEAGGNIYEAKGPPEAATLRCPAGTRRVQGVPDGLKWTSRLPGWLALCQKPDGTRHGPMKGWHRLGKGLQMQGEYSAGQRSGAWKFWEAGSAAPITEANYAKGRLHGPWVTRTTEGTILYEGSFRAGLREGLWKLANSETEEELQAPFVAGLPQGTWRWLKADGSVVRQLEFDKGIPRGEASPEDTSMLVATQDLETNTVVEPRMLTSRPLAKSFVVPHFILEENAQYVHQQRVGATMPKGAPMMWMDFEMPGDPPAPVPPSTGK